MTVMGKSWAFKFYLLTEKRVSVTDVPVWFFFFIKCRFCHSILLCFEQSFFAIKLYYSLHSFCIFEHVFCFVCLHFLTLPFCFCVFFSLLFVFFFLLSKTPRKAVLFHEYQASTGRFNKFVSLLATSLSLLWTLCQSMCMCVFVCMSV